MRHGGTIPEAFGSSPHGPKNKIEFVVTLKTAKNRSGRMNPPRRPHASRHHCGRAAGLKVGKTA